MPTTVILKTDNKFTYSDYVLDKAALRFSELDTGVQAVRRTHGGAIVAYVMSAATYDGLVGAFGADDPMFPQSMTEVSDDYLNSNWSKAIDLIQGNAQTAALAALVAAEGTTVNSIKSYKVINSKGYYLGDRVETAPYGDDTLVKGEVVGYILHPAMYAYLQTTPTATTYSGTGDGTISDIYMVPGSSVAETITITATSATEFSVTGSVSGALGTATVGTTFTSSVVSFLLTAGATPFVATDEFVVTVVDAII